MSSAAIRGARVVLLDEGWAQTLCLAAALDAAGHAVTVVTANGKTARHRRGAVDWRCGPALESPQFLPHLERTVVAEAFDHVLPLTEAIMTRLWDAGPAWAARIYPVVDERQRWLLRDKHRM